MSIGTSATPLGQVRGSGSAQHGGEHWMHERLTSAASLLLGLWLIISLLLLPSLDRLTRVSPSAEAYLEDIKRAPYMDGVWDEDVERYFRESMLPRIAPVSSQLILSFIAEKVLGQAKSY